MPGRQSIDHPSGRRRALWLLGALGCLMLSGCGLVGGGGSSETPEGFVRTSTKVLSFAYPQEWQRLPEGTYPEGWPIAVGKQSDGGRSAEVAVFAKLPDAPGAKLAIEAINAKFQFTHNFKRKKDRAIEVPSAKSAWRLDYTYNAEGPEGGASDQRILGTDVAVVDQRGNTQVLRITRRPGAMRAADVELIVGSIMVKSGD